MISLVLVKPPILCTNCGSNRSTDDRSKMAYMGIPTNPTLSGMAASQQHPFLAMSNPLALAAANSAGAVANSAPTIINVGALMNQKDSRWLQLEVCREYQRNKCSRSDGECKFAHPPESIEIQNGRVTACYDSIKVSKQEKHKDASPYECLHAEGEHT